LIPLFYVVKLDRNLWHKREATQFWMSFDRGSTFPDNSGVILPSRKIPETILPIDPDAPDVAANEQRGDNELEEVKRLILEKGSTPKQGRRNPK
jgi:hypothetical protein